MKNPTITDYYNYQQFIDNLYLKELGLGAKFSMFTSLTPAILSESELQGFVDRYKTIKEFWSISQNLFKNSLYDNSLSEIRDLILNEVNLEFSLEYHRALYDKIIDQPYFFRTDESVPGKITEIQSPGSGWGTLQVLQQSLSYLIQFVEVPSRQFYKSNDVLLADSVSRSITELTNDHPFVFHQIDESSVMLDTNYFISTTRKKGLKYLGHDHEVTFKNVNFIRTHSFMEQATSSAFFEFLKRYYNGELLFDIFPSILFFQKIAILFPFWHKTRHLYSEKIRAIFPFTSLVTNNLELEGGKQMTFEEFCNLKPHERNYYLKYAGADGTINWGSKAVFHLGKTDWKKCRLLLEEASNGYLKKRYWVLQKAYHRKEKINSITTGQLAPQESYGKWSGFYGPNGFMGGYVMSRGFYKVHGQDDTVCRLLI